MVAADKPTLEVASSNRSSCQRCKRKSRRARCVPACRRATTTVVAEWRSGVPVKNLRVDYAPTDRAKCKGDGNPIAKGEPRVLFRLLDCVGNVNTQCIFKPPNAAEYLAELGRCEGVSLDIGAIDGMDELEPEHRAWTKSALAGGEAVASTPRREPPEKPKAPKAEGDGGGRRRGGPPPRRREGEEGRAEEGAAAAGGGLRRGQGARTRLTGRDRYVRVREPWIEFRDYKLASHGDSSTYSPRMHAAHAHTLTLHMGAFTPGGPLRLLTQGHIQPGYRTGSHRRWDVIRACRGHGSGRGTWGPLTWGAMHVIRR